MKKLFVLIIFLYSNGLFAENSTIDIKFNICSDSTLSEYYKKVKLNLFQDDSLIYVLTTNTLFGNSFQNLSKGNYTIKYKQYHGKFIEKDIKIDSAKTYIVKICFDSIQRENFVANPFINQLKTGESFILDLYTSGCFHQYQETIKFYKKDKNLIIMKYKSSSDKVGANQLDRITKFETQLTTKSFIGLCTTISTFELTYKNQTIRIADGTCGWNGYSDLKKILNISRN